MSDLSALATTRAKRPGTPYQVIDSKPRALPAGGRVAGVRARAAVERGEVAAAAPVLPRDAVAAHVQAAAAVGRRVDHRRRRRVHLGDARERRVVAQLEAHERFVVAAVVRAPDAVVDGVHGRRVAAERDAVVARRVHRLVGLGPARRDEAVAVRVDDRRAPALRRLGVAGLVPDLRVHPADALAEAASLSPLSIRRGWRCGDPVIRSPPGSAAGPPCSCRCSPSGCASAGPGHARSARGPAGSRRAGSSRPAGRRG